MSASFRPAAALIAVALASAMTTATSSGAPPRPLIISVTLKGSVASPTFVVIGRYFGARPAPSQPPTDSSACKADNPPGDQGLNYGNRLYFHDLTNNLSAGLSGPFGNTPNVIDCVGLIVKSFTPTRVAYSPGSDYGAHPYAVNSGDAVTFVVNAAKATLKIRYGATIPNPAVCVVPRLKGKTLARARAAVVRARCALGTVRGLKSGKIATQTPAANAAVAAGTRVTVRLR